MPNLDKTSVNTALVEMNNNIRRRRRTLVFLMTKVKVLRKVGFKFAFKMTLILAWT